MELIECAACSRAISPLAEACPGCGAPNSWQHPLITAFFTAKDKIGTSRPFTFRARKAKIWGETKSRAPLWAKIIMVLLGIIGTVVGFTFWGVIGVLVAGVIAAIPVIAAARSERFSADLEARTWTSTNDDFWRPVKSKLLL